MTSHLRRLRGGALPQADRERLAAIVHELGEVEALRRLGVSKNGLTRALSGLNILRGTAVLLRTGVEAIRSEARAETPTGEAGAETGAAPGSEPEPAPGSRATEGGR